ncbi:MAG: AraC family transcriptional regulator [bacterium]
MTQKIRDGFGGQKMIRMPAEICNMNLQQHPFNNLFITDIGYFPKAAFHYVKRDEGCPQYILIYCVSGEGWFITSSGHGVVKPNQYVIIPANMKHRYGANPENPWSIYWVHFCGLEAASFLYTLNLEKAPRSVDVFYTEERIKIFNEMYDSLELGYSKENIGFSNMCLWYFMATLIYGEHYKKTLQSKELDVVDSVIQYMKLNLKKTITLEELAENSNTSVSNFSKLFKKKTGYAPIDYFIRLKIQSACQYLNLTDYRVKEVCSFLGFKDQYYFSRIFTKIMGQSPTQYKLNQKG